MGKLQDVLEEYEPYAYIGRGMYGKRSLAVNIDDGNIGRLVALIISAVNDESREELADAVKTMAMDSMGHGLVVYFPGVPYDAERP